MIDEQVATGKHVGRRKGMRRAWFALPVAAVLLLSGCGDDNKDDDAKSTPSASAPVQTTPGGTTPSTPSGGDAPSGGTTLSGEEKKVADNWDKLFDNTAQLDDRKQMLQDSDKMGKLVDTLAADPMAKAISAKTKAVTINGDTATVTYDIIAAGAPVFPNLTGEAVKQDGSWKVSLKSICGLVGTLKPGSVVEGCPSA